MLSAMRAPDSLMTRRMGLRLRRPAVGDAAAIFTRYAGDPEVTQFLGWARHRSVGDAEAFLQWSDESWRRSPAGPYLIETPEGRLLGSTGLEFEAPWRAATGYVLARDAWGQGYGTEVALAMGELADALRVRRLYALCHVAHRASARVLAKSGFECEGVLRRYLVFPNLGADEPSDVECWARVR